LVWPVRIIAGGALIIVLTVAYRSTPNETVAGLKRPVTEASAKNGKRLYFSADEIRTLAALQPKGRTIKSALNVTKSMHYGEFVWDDAGVPPGDIWIKVDLASQLISIYRGGHEIGTAVIMYGVDDKPTPTGEFAVLWRKQNHQSSIYEAEMPYTLRLTNDGVAIHGADVRARAATHGCVSVPTDFAALLFTQVKVGDTVTILPEKQVSI
jgi:lipoprotein-anchoring transpeptidase ErfK/SrfK